MILFINTSNFGELQFALLTNTVVHEFNTQVAFNENYKTNEFLGKFFKKYKVNPKQLTHIVVCSGPGSFTGIRVGVSLAQALSFALGIPLHTIPKDKIPDPIDKLRTTKFPKKNLLHYGAAPNITISKKKTR